MWRYCICMLVMCQAACWADEEIYADLVTDHTEFAFAFYAATPQEGVTTVFSPYALSRCLEMLLIGARSDTADEIQKALRLNGDKTQLPAASLALTQQLLPKEGKSYRLNSANGLWLGQEFFILSDYSHTIENAFQGKISRLNFAHPPQAVQTINQWVSEKTEGKIPNLLQSSDLTQDTRLILTSAVYFQGSWASPFSVKATVDSPFYPTPETSSSLPMMQQTGYFPYFENDLLQILALPFAGHNSGARMACLLLLPRSADNLPHIETLLTDSWSGWLGELKGEQIAMKIPKFTVMTPIDLKTPLQKLGMELAFTTQANFSGIDGKLDLYLSKALHQAFFALDEAGVTAAAGTAAVLNAKAVQAPATPFVADHPFLFFIVDLKSQEILFMGTFQAPRETHA